MRFWLVVLCIVISASVAGVVGFVMSDLAGERTTIIEAEPTPVPTPLSKYEIENLEKVEVPAGAIKITDTLSEEDNFTSYLFSHKFDPTLASGEEKTVTGQINLPNDSKKHPLVLMIRGYVDQKIYETGIGTKNAAAYFADNGFITVAPDFLGYAGSSSEAGDIYETRFQTYTTVLSILSSLQSIKEWNGNDLFIWAHSNGGQIALTSLAASGMEIPTTLWAPVTKPFPYSILYYTDESTDGGKYIRRELANFEELYDVDKFSFTNYLDHINAPLQIHQGTADDAIPVMWTDSFVAKIRALEKEVEYYKYPGADHNMRPDWDTVVERDLKFFNSFIEK